jgi:ABC-2 type transport system ATP-binding protein
MPAIELVNLSKDFGSKRAVNNVNLTVEKGRIFGLFGANGSGKSTIVNMMTGLLSPTSGSVMILDSPISFDNIELKRKVGVLPEKLALFGSLSIWEHIRLVGEIYGLGFNDIIFRGEQLLRYLDLWENRFSKIDHCSFGMKKKTSLALAVIHNPEVAFLDEPFEGVDPIASRNIKAAIESAAAKNCTFFITSHSLAIMEQIVDSFAIICSGDIVYHGAIENVHAGGDTLESIYFRHIKNDVSGDLGWLGQ